VKLTIMFRGREIYHKELGERILDQVAERVAHLAKVEVVPRLDGRNMTMVLAPDKKAQAAHARQLAVEADAVPANGDHPVAEAVQVPAEAPPEAAPVEGDEQAPTPEPTDAPG
jgi:translation initiation factor IF-3